ncbi:heterokaryon incompatibility protein-domain-containing protein [Leptodontidium sp. MPI-SDFR-AT-0119]|nr:heterokaryon incompatibility protein-domain-containing protein [Leptodontidium sp. MPI-SDFR-AT-0119]
MDCLHAKIRENCYAANEFVTDLRASANTCLECDLLLRVVEEYTPGWLDARANGIGSLEGVILLDHWSRPGKVFLKEGPAGNFDGWRNSAKWFDGLQTVASFSFFRKAKEELVPERDNSLRRVVAWESLAVVEDSSLASAFDRAGKWLTHCVDHDEKCRIPNPSYMPRRLLNVGTWEPDREPFLFEPAVPVPYACLSYCWGADTTGVLTTTTRNLDAHYSAVPMLAMPMTVRDAVILCRGLKVDNIWVDSLCIVQDDATDWLQQSAEMRDIYANSHLTVAVLEPASCKLGFLGEQKFGKPDWQRECIINVPKEAGGPGSRVLLRPVEAKTEHNFKGDEDEDERCSLDTRGWCLQESLLPNRRLCFNGREMSWECLSRKTCECGHVLWTYRPDSYGRLGGEIKKGYEKAHWDRSSHRDWIRIVQEYSERSLTQGTDKLRAISGLAKMILDAPPRQSPARRFNFPMGLPPPPKPTIQSYAAGLWKDSFIPELAWIVKGFGPSLNNPICYLAPSWSWASVSGSVRFHDTSKGGMIRKYSPIRRMDCTLDGVVCETILASDPTGPVKSAHAILRGPLVSVDLAILDSTLSAIWDRKRDWHMADHPTRPHTSLVRGKGLQSIEVFLDRPREVSVYDRDPQGKCWIGKCVKGHQGCLLEGNGLDRTNAAGTDAKDLAYCLRLFTWETYTRKIQDQGRPAESDVRFLVLQRSPTDQAAFERIGLGNWHGGDSNMPLFSAAETSSVKIV